MRDASPPRFVPILTEVVETAADLPSVPAPEAGNVSPAPVSQEELARRVAAQVLAELEPMVLEALRTIQAQQARSLEVLVRTELAARVARLVGESLTHPARGD